MGNTYANLLYHAVLSTKDREPLIDEKWQDDLYAYMRGIVRGSRGTLLKSGGVADHVHLLLKLPASVAIADMLRLVKANSSNWVRDSNLVIGKPGSRGLRHLAKSCRRYAAAEIAVRCAANGGR